MTIQIGWKREDWKMKIGFKIDGDDLSIDEENILINELKENYVSKY